MRLLRGLFTILLTALCLAVVVVWLRSYFHSETFFRIENDRVLAIDSFGGEISFWRGQLPVAEPIRYGHEHWSRGSAITSIQQPVVNPAGEDLWLAGFGYTSQRRFPLTGRSITEGSILAPQGAVIPFWSIALTTGILLGLRLRRAYRARQFAQLGRCQACGYDLRASSDRCPECGTPITPVSLDAESPRTAS